VCSVENAENDETKARIRGVEVAKRQRGLQVREEDVLKWSHSCSQFRTGGGESRMYRRHLLE